MLLTALTIRTAGGVVKHADDRPLSTFVRRVTLGIYPLDWASSGAEFAEAGERL
jgi:hypothetical protein